MRESCSWEGNTYAKYIFNPHRSWRDGSGSPTGTRIVDKAYAAKRLLDSIYGIRNFLWYAILLTTYEMIQGASGQTPHSAEKDGDADAAKRALIPYGHTTLPVSLTVLVDANGCIRGVAKRKSTIIIPCTEESMGRTIKPVPHPLFDQLQYVDSGRSPEKTSMYLQQLAKWKGDDAKLEAVFKCVSEHSISEAAAHYGVELTDKDDKAGVCFEVQIGLEDSDLSNDVDIHGTLTGNQAIVVWAIKRPEEKPVLNPQSGSFDFDDSFSSIADESKALHDDISDALNATNVQYAKIFSRVLRGYEGAEDLKKHNDPMVVVILDAATTGRLGVTFYCELQKDEYIKRILQWHVDAAWPLTSFKKSIVEGAERVNVVQYEGAPSFTDIINCACDTSDRSSKSYKRFAKDVKERLIECMFGGAQFPMSILNAACHKVTRPMGYDNIRVWRRDFEIACSLWKKHYIDETRKQHRQEDVITMYLEPNRDDRDYLYGRLLALADNFEESVLRKQGVKDRPTNAIKLMSNFTAKPYTTWGTLWKQLTPYLKSANGGSWFRNEVDDVMALFKEGDFEDNKALSPMFLLGYPIEYKHGKSKTIDADRLQLCAEAMCLEEMLACDIPEGALFYQQTKRRERVKFDEDLRNMVEADFLQMHDLFSRGWTPKVKQTRSCSACSLRDLCLPELRKMKSAKAYIEERLKESGE